MSEWFPARVGAVRVGESWGTLSKVMTTLVRSIIFTALYLPQMFLEPETDARIFTLNLDLYLQLLKLPKVSCVLYFHISSFVSDVRGKSQLTN